MKFYKITKHYQGGSTIYYASMPSTNIMRYKTWNRQLKEWGDNTDGGYNYGWRITAKQVQKIPSKFKTKFNLQFRILKFNKDYLKTS